MKWLTNNWLMNEFNSELWTTKLKLTNFGAFERLLCRWGDSPLLSIGKAKQMKVKKKKKKNPIVFFFLIFSWAMIVATWLPKTNWIKLSNNSRNNLVISQGKEQQQQQQHSFSIRIEYWIVFHFNSVKRVRLVPI